MNYVFSVIRPEGLPVLAEQLASLGLPLSVVMHAHGTADQSVLDLLGLKSKERRVVMTVATAAKTDELIKRARRALFIDAPGNGVVVAVPVKSVGGGKTLAYLSGNQPVGGVPNIQPDYELIVVIANEGHTDQVMTAARQAGATGGTILHGKGTGAADDSGFLHVSLAAEKEVVLIVAKAENKADMMASVLRNAGPSTEAGAVVFSLPVTQTAGFSLMTE